MSSVTIQDSTKFHISEKPIHSEMPISQFIASLQKTAKSVSDLFTFNANVSSLCSFIPNEMHTFIAVDVLTVMLLTYFPNFAGLSQALTTHLDSLFRYLIRLDEQSQQHLQEFTSYLILLVKQIINHTIDQNLKASQVFILLTCTELFQNIQKLPLELVIQAVNNCHYRSEFIESPQSLPSFYSLLCQTSAPFLPKYCHKEFTLVLDLDETLGHYSQSNFLVRPGVKEFLKETCKYFELVLFTASSREYADWAMQIADPDGFIMLRLYREHTINCEIKDLEKLGRDIEKVVIIDNFPKAFEKQPHNGISIKAWTGDVYDRELFKLIKPLCESVQGSCKGLKDIVNIINSKC